MPCVCDPETCRIMNASQRDYIPFPTGESYEDDVIPMGLFSLATLWLKLDTHTRFCSWGNMSTIATSACHAYMHRSCIFRWFLITGLPLPEYWSVAWRRKKEMQQTSVLWWTFIFMYSANNFIQGNLCCVQGRHLTFILIHSCIHWELDPWHLVFLAPCSTVLTKSLKKLVKVLKVKKNIYIFHFFSKSSSFSLSFSPSLASLYLFEQCLRLGVIATSSVCLPLQD